ncbi:M16 family metallopeptidase [Petrachloros mirabilis]
MRNPTAIAVCTAVVLSTLLVPGGMATGQDLAEFEKRMTEFTLDNGMKFLVLERHGVPVVTCYTHANVGAADTCKGKTGMAHLFEHMAFKGTETIGTTDYEAEVKLMARTDQLFQAIKRKERTGKKTDEQFPAELYRRFKEAQQAERGPVVHGEFEEILKRAGGVGLNARTNYDSTVYFVSLPSNKLELWTLLESDRFLHPVLREFYSERDTVMEERRQRVENNPVGQLGEEFLALAYRAHPYRQPSIGHMSDLRTVARDEARAFFDEYYGPGSLTVAVVGDVDPGWVRELAHDYFGRIPARAQPESVQTEEPPQLGERRVVVEYAAQPIVLIGYHKPNVNHPDDIVFDVITDILSSGRTARLYKTLVKEKRIAVSTASFSGTPGNKYPGLYVFHAVPAKDHTNKECEEAIYAEIERMIHEPVEAEELRKAKTRACAGLIRLLTSNQGLAGQLAFYEVITGDWRNLFKRLERIEQVNAEDVQRVAKACFTTRNRVVGMIETIPAQK